MSTLKVNTVTNVAGTLYPAWSEVDRWMLTSNASTSQNPIDANWSRAARSGGSGITQNLPYGTGMTESSGVFTFPSVGKWWVRFQGNVRHSSGNMWAEAYIQGSGNSGTNWNSFAVGYDNQYDDSNWVYGTINTDTFIDIEDTSTDKVRFSLLFDTSGDGVIIGSNPTSGPNATMATFIRIGPT